MTIGQRIAQKRKEQGFSQEALGEQLGVSRQAIYKWESDGALPEIDKLLTLSRLFGVTVGWLLGVEEEPERAADDEAEPQTDAELSPQQLQMVEEITKRYLAAQPKKSPWGKWDVRILFAAIGLLVASVLTINGKVNRLDSNYNNLQNSVYNVQSNLNGQIGSITNRMEELLKAQNDLTADYGTELLQANLQANTITFSAYAVPKSYAEGMTAFFAADYGAGVEETGSTALTDGKFAATVTCPLTDTITLSVVFVHADATRQTQLLDSYDGLYSASFPEISVQSYDHMYNERPTAEGKLTMGEMYAAIRTETDSVAAVNTKLGQMGIDSIRVGLFKNKALVAWAEAVDGVPSSFSGDGWENAQFYRLPATEIDFGQGDELCVAAIITDQYGRISLQSDAPYILGDDGALTWPTSCDTSDHSPDGWDF